MRNGLRWSEGDDAEYQARRRTPLPAVPHGAASIAPTVATVAIPQDRYKSETERRFAQLLDRWTYEGKVRAWHYEPMKGLYLAPATSYTVDWLIEPSTTN